MQHLISKNLSVFVLRSRSLAPGEEALLPVRLIFDDELPDSIKSVVLSYTIFDVTDYNDLEMTQHHNDNDHHDGHEMEASL